MTWISRPLLCVLAALQGPESLGAQGVRLLSATVLGPAGLTPGKYLGFTVILCILVLACMLHRLVMTVLFLIMAI